MAEQSFCTKLGMRLGILGTAASLAWAAPIATGDYDATCHTDAGRIGAYFVRTAGSEQAAWIVGGQAGPIWTRSGAVVNEVISGSMQSNSIITGAISSSIIANSQSVTCKNGLLVGIALVPQGGAANFTGSITTVLLSANRTYTFPDASITLGSGTIAGTATQDEVAFGSAANTLTSTSALTFVNATYNRMRMANASSSQFNDHLLVDDLGNYFQFGKYGSAYAGNLSSTGIPFAGLALIQSNLNNIVFMTGTTVPIYFCINAQAPTLTIDTNLLNIAGNVKLKTAGNGIYIKEGANATSGVVTLIGGTLTVSTSKVTANSRIYLTRQNNAGTVVGSVDVTARNAGADFTITAGGIADTSDVAWLIVEPA